MTTEDSTTPIHAFVRSDVVRSAFLAPLEASGWSIAPLRDSTDLAALLRDASYAVLVVDSAAAPPMPGPWVQGVYVGSGEAPEGLAARPFATPVGQLAADLRRMAFVAQLASLRAGRAHQARGFLEDVALRSCLAALVGRKASGTLRFHGPRGEGCVYVREGRVIDVECAGLRGEEALARLLAWTEGSVHVAEGSVLGDALMTRATDDVFAEAERMAATVSSALVLLPKPGVPLQLERFLAARIVPNPSADLEKLLGLVDGTRDVIAVLDASPFDDASTARTLARFAQGGAIHAVGTASQAEEVAPPSVSLVARHTPMSLPQVTLQMDAPVVATNAAATAAPSAPQHEPVSSVGASTPVGLFAAAVSAPAPQASAAFEPTPMTPGVEEIRAAQQAAGSDDAAAEPAPARRTPISVETPAKAALDAAFRKAAQESQAALAASGTMPPSARRSQPPGAVNDRAKRLVGGIAVAALALFGIVGVKSMLPEPAAPQPASVPAPAPVVQPSPAAESPAPAAEPAAPTEVAEVPSVEAAEAAQAVVADAEAAPAPAAAAPAVAAPAVAVPVVAAAAAAPVVAAAPAWATAAAPKLPPGRLQKAKDFLDKGQFVSASIEAQSVVQGDPSQAEAWLVLGAAALGQEKTAEAKHFFGECVRRGRGPAVDECRHFMNQ
jgi:hypothetical protein